MNIKNIAIVRATNAIPFDGIVRPISEVPYLKKEEGTQFSFAMYDLLKSKNMFKKIDWTNLDEISEINRENNEILNQYMPYNSYYNSMVLWSLNGLVPDDMNNTFSNKTCAIIDGLQEQIEQSKIISLVPTDTAIKGNTKLSNSAKILINKERYEKLSQKEKEALSKLNVNIIIFEGDLKQAIDKELVKENRYTAETLSLSREDNGYIKSDTSDDVRETISNIANEKKIAQVLHWNVITAQNDELDKLADVKDEYRNIAVVTEYYKETFFEYLFSKMDIDNKIKGDVSRHSESPQYMQALCGEIDRIGIDKYKQLVTEYNKSLEELREKGKLPTPQEIVDSIAEKKKIDLVSMIEENINSSDISKEQTGDKSKSFRESLSIGVPTLEEQTKNSKAFQSKVASVDNMDLNNSSKEYIE